MPAPLIGLANLKNLFPDQAVELGQAQGSVPQPPSPNLQDAPQLDVTQSPPPSPEDQAAGIMAGAAAGGTRDRVSNLLLEAGIQGAGPLSGLFGALGAAIAGKDPDMAASLAQQGFRQLEQDIRARKAFAMQQHEQRLRTLRQAISVAKVAGVKGKDLRGMVDQFFTMANISLPETSRQMISNAPELRAVLPWFSPNPKPEDVETFTTWVEENGLDPQSDPSIAIAFNHIQNAFKPPAGAEDGELMDHDEAVASLVAQAKETGVEISEETARLLLPGRSGGSIRGVDFRAIVDNVVAQGGDELLGFEFGALAADRLGVPEMAGVAARMPWKQAAPFINALRDTGKMTDTQLLASIVEKTSSGIELTPAERAQATFLQAQHADRMARGLQAVQDLRLEVMASSDENSPPTPAEVILNAAEMSIMQSLGEIPSALRTSEMLGKTNTPEELLGAVPGLYDDLNLTVGVGQ